MRLRAAIPWCMVGLRVAVVWGIVCDLEGLAMSMILPEWRRDVKTLRRALDLRREMREEIEA